MKPSFFRAVAALVAIFMAFLTLIWLKPPELLRVGAAYSAKIVCSNVFLAHRDATAVLRDDVQTPGIWILRLMHASVDDKSGSVHANFLGFIGNGIAVARPGKGCTVVPDGKVETAREAPQPTEPSPASAADTPATAPNAASSTAAPPAAVTSTAATSAAATPQAAAPAAAQPLAAPADPDRPWPDGDAVALNPAVQDALFDDKLAGPGMRAIVVVSQGRIVGERYAKGFDAGMPQLGWSMTKSVTAGLIGVLVKEGKLSLDQAGFWPTAPGDGRDKIRIADLMSMSSGLRFNEDYGVVSDVTRMLFLEPNMAGFAAAQPLVHPVGKSWSYSSGAAVILSRILQDAAGMSTPSFADARLFQPLGMRSAVIEADEHGTLVGSSYMYATARDWGRYGELLANDGIWQGQEILPKGYVSMMATPVPASGGQYGKGMVWIFGSETLSNGVNPDAAFGIPGDAFWMSGHDGQSIAIIRSRHLVIVRLGLTPHTVLYAPQPLVKAVLEATRETPTAAPPQPPVVQPAPEPMPAPAPEPPPAGEPPNSSPAPKPEPEPAPNPASPPAPTQEPAPNPAPAPETPTPNPTPAPAPEPAPPPRSPEPPAPAPQPPASPQPPAQTTPPDQTPPDQTPPHRVPPDPGRPDQARPDQAPPDAGRPDQSPPP